MELLRQALLWIAVAGYAAVAARMIRARLWLRYPIFLLMLIADGLNITLAGPYDVAGMNVSERLVPAIKALTALEAWWRLSDDLWQPRRYLLIPMAACLGLAATVNAWGVYSPDDILAWIKNYRLLVHAGVAVGGLSALLFVWLYGRLWQYAAWHTLLLAAWFAAVAAAILTKPQDLAAWLLANCAMRLAVIACLGAWWWVIGRDRQAGAEVDRNSP